MPKLLSKLLQLIILVVVQVIVKGVQAVDQTLVQVVIQSNGLAVVQSIRDDFLPVEPFLQAVCQ